MLPNFTQLDPVIDGTPVIGSNTYNPNVAKTNVDFQIIKSYTDKPNGGSGWTANEIANRGVNNTHYVRQKSSFPGLLSFGVPLSNTTGTIVASGSFITTIDNPFIELEGLYDFEPGSGAGKFGVTGYLEISQNASFTPKIEVTNKRTVFYKTSPGLDAVYNDVLIKGAYQSLGTGNQTWYVRLRVISTVGTNYSISTGTNILRYEVSQKPTI